MSSESTYRFRNSLAFRWVAFFVAYVVINMLLRLMFGHAITGQYLVGQAANAAIGATLWIGIIHFLSRRQKAARARTDDKQS